jgi:hypothetical protein
MPTKVRCPDCSSDEVRRSRGRWWHIAFYLFGMRPCRCTVCTARLLVPLWGRLPPVAERPGDAEPRLGAFASLRAGPRPSPAEREKWLATPYPLRPDDQSAGPRLGAGDRERGRGRRKEGGGSSVIRRRGV